MTQSLGTLIGLLSEPEFTTGLGIGLIAAFLLVAPQLRSQWALVTTTAALGAINFLVERRLGLLLGIATASIGLLLVRGERLPRAVGGTVAAAGLFLIAWRAGLGDRELWISALLPLVGLTAGWWAFRWSTDSRASLPFLTVVSAFGIWTAIPETNVARSLLAVAFVMWLAAAALKSQTGSTGAVALMMTMAWVVAQGGAPRPGSVVGGWMIVLGTAWWAWARRARALSRRELALFHGLFVLVAARLIGLWETGLAALVGSLFLAGATWLAVYMRTSRVTGVT